MIVSSINGNNNGWVVSFGIATAIASLILLAVAASTNTARIDVFEEADAEVLEGRPGLLLADYDWVRYGAHLWDEAVSAYFGTLGAIEDGRNGWQLNPTLGNFSIHAFAIFCRSKTLSGGTKVHDAMKIEELDVSIVSLRVQIAQELPDTLCRQFSLNRMKRDFRHINEAAQRPTTDGLQQRDNAALALRTPFF